MPNEPETLSQGEHVPADETASHHGGEGRAPAHGSAAHSEIVEAFVRLHTSWLGATHRRDMNAEMDALARILGLDPLSLKPLNDEAERLAPGETP